MTNEHVEIGHGSHHSAHWLTALASLTVGACFFALWFWLLPAWLGFHVDASGSGRWRWIAAIPSVLGFAVALRSSEATVLYNAACVFCLLKRKPDALNALKKAWDAGFKAADWARRDPDLSSLHDEPEFEQLYPAASQSQMK